MLTLPENVTRDAQPYAFMNFRVRMDEMQRAARGRGFPAVVALDWHGHPDKLEPVTGMLIGWLRLMKQGIDMKERSDGDHFACRLEIYETNPDEEPDMNKWLTRLAFKLKG